MKEKTIQERVDEYRAKVDGILGEFPEAGAVAYATVYTGDVPINLTQRANNIYDAYVAFKMGMDLLSEVFGVAFEREIQEAPHPVDAEFPNEPVYVDLEPKSHVFTVKALSHGKTQAGKSVIKVFIQEEYEYANKKYGMTAFGGGPDGWEKWSENAQYAPPEGFGHVVVSDPKDGGKYANIEQFKK